MSKVDDFKYLLKKWKQDDLKDYELHDAIVILAQELQNEIDKNDYPKDLRSAIKQWAKKELHTVTAPIEQEL